MIWLEITVFFIAVACIVEGSFNNNRVSWMDATMTESGNEDGTPIED